MTGRVGRKETRRERSCKDTEGGDRMMETWREGRREGQRREKRKNQSDRREEGKEAKRTGRKEKGIEKNETKCQGEKRLKEDWAGKKTLSIVSVQAPLLHANIYSNLINELLICSQLNISYIHDKVNYKLFI